ncbi:MAG: hypothetical protein V3T72_21245 [Thermoanaerobaculia bacterium]
MSPGSLMPFRTSELGTSALAPAGRRDELPDRYTVREREGARFLSCDEAPGVAVSIDRRYAFAEADARRLGERVILLDGAGQFGPLIDDAGNLYNLDHHEGCLRAFTLSTCEQALILVLKGLRLDKGDWTLYANEPDLDTVFAIWLLLNYRRVRDLRSDQRDVVLPLLRLEGAIDANGLEIADYCGLPRQALAVARERLEQLHGEELDVKRSGVWSQIDLYEYTRDKLLALDHLVYRAADFGDYASIEEVYGHVEIGGDNVAVICRDGSGIYEVEKRLKKVWGDRLGLIALEKDKGHYTLRRTAGLSGIALADAYRKLNLLDPVVDGRPPQKRWGGSDDIGGSPRPEGTGLTPREISKILRLSYKAISSWQHLRRLASAVTWVLSLVLGTGAMVSAWQVFRGFPRSGDGAAAELLLVASILSAGSWLATRRLSRGWKWLFGWRAPAGFDWLALVPVVLVAAVAGGSWIPRSVDGSPASPSLMLSAIFVAAIATELCFRGLLHGAMILESRVQRVRGRWFLSRPAIAAGFLYAVATAAVVDLGVWIAPPSHLLPALGEWGTAAIASALAGLALGVMRERSLSVWPGVAALTFGSLLRLLL